MSVLLILFPFPSLFHVRDQKRGRNANDNGCQHMAHQDEPPQGIKVAWGIGRRLDPRHAKNDTSVEFCHHFGKVCCSGQESKTRGFHSLFIKNR